MKYFKLFFLLNLLLFLISCGFVQEGFKNQKKDNSDEFLVEKKSPLVLPTNYGKLPVPDDISVTEKSNSNEIKDLLISDSKKSNSGKKNKSNSTSLKRSILDKIK